MDRRIFFLQPSLLDYLEHCFTLLNIKLMYTFNLMSSSVPYTVSKLFENITFYRILATETECFENI